MHKVTPGGDVSTFIQNSSWGRPIGIAIGPTGIVVISDESNGALYAIFADGSSATLYSGSPLSSPNGVVVLGPEVTGDVNCSTAVDAIDAALLLQNGAGLFPALVCQHNADVNESGGFDSIDASLILQLIAGLIGSLPV